MRQYSPGLTCSILKSPFGWMDNVTFSAGALVLVLSSYGLITIILASTLCVSSPETLPVTVAYCAYAALGPIHRNRKTKLRTNESGVHCECNLLIELPCNKLARTMVAFRCFDSCQSVGGYLR